MPPEPHGPGVWRFGLAGLLLLVLAAPARAEEPAEPQPAPPEVGSVAPAPVDAAAVTAAARPAPAGSLADLDLVVNGEPKGSVVVLLEGDDVWADPGDLERAGLAQVAGRRRLEQGRERISLRSLAPALAFAVDEPALQLQLTAGPALLGRSTIDLRSTPRPAGLVARGDLGTFLDYAVEARSAGRPLATFELGSSGDGWLAVTGLARTEGGDWARGLTSLTRDEPDALRRWIAGDAVASAGPLGGGALLGGLSVQRELSLDPYALRGPLPRGTAVATSPSTLEVYVNGALVRRERLAPGTYDLANLPATSGAGVVQAVLRDAFGRTQELDARYYYSSGLLREGETDYGYHLGFAREAPGTPGLGYGKPLAIARHRLGLSDGFTAGLRAEGAERRASGGPTLNAGTAWGELELALAGSQASGKPGGAAHLAWSFQQRRISAGLRLEAQSERYATSTLLPGADRPLLSGDALLGVGVSRAATVEVGLRLQRWRDTGEAAALSARASVNLGGAASLVLSAVAGRQPDGSRGLDLLAMISWAMGARSSGEVGARRLTAGGAQGTAAAQQALPRGDGFGYRVSAAGGPGPTSSSAGLGQAQARTGIYEAEWSQTGQAWSGRASAAGGLLLMDGRLFATRPVDSSYALVSVPGVAGVRVEVENQEVGRTDGNGHLLVPELLPYHANRISIRGEDVPLEFELGSTERLVAPPPRGGTVARFEVRRSAAVTGQLAPARPGEARPANGEMQVEAGSVRASSPVTPDGRFWLEGLPPGRHRALVTWGSGSCHAVLEVEAGGARARDLGAVACVADEPRHAAADEG